MPTTMLAPQRRAMSAEPVLLYDGLNFVRELTSGGTPTANLLTGLGIDETFTRTVSGGSETLLTDELGAHSRLPTGPGRCRPSTRTHRSARL
jgi:hypothetical protein